MKQCLIIRNAYLCFCIVGLIIFHGCKNQNDSEDQEILNQIFFDLVVEMKIPPSELFDYPPPSISFSEDSAIRSGQLLEYEIEMRNYHQSIFDFSLRSFYHRSPDSLTILVYDSLFPCNSLSGIKKEDLPSDEFREAADKMGEKKYFRQKIDIKQLEVIDNIGIEYASESHWKPGMKQTKRTTSGQEYITGILYITRIYLNDSKDHGLFYCTYVYGIEPLTLLIYIEKLQNHWQIVGSELVS